MWPMLCGQIEGAVYMEQFESQANFNAHYHSTGPEVRTNTSYHVM